MNEEKRQVLDLLRAGKITQEQAQRLLEALGEDPAPEPPVSGDFTPAAPGLPPRLAELQAAAQSKLEEARNNAQSKLEKALAQLQKAREALTPTTSCEEELEAQLEEAEAQLDEADAAWDDLEGELDDADALWDDLEAELEDMEEELDSAPGANAQWKTQWKAQWDASWNTFRDQWQAQRDAAQAALEARQSPGDAPDKAPSKLDKALSKFQKATASLAARFPWAAPHPGQAGAPDQAPPQRKEPPADPSLAQVQQEAAQTEREERQAAQDEAQAALAEAQAQMDEVQGEWEAAQAEFAAYQIGTDNVEEVQNESYLEKEAAGPSEDEVGPQEDEVGPQEDEVGPDGGETGPNPGDFGSNAGQTGSIPGDFCLYNPQVPAPAAPLIPLPLEPHSYELPTPGPISRLQVNWVNGPVEVRPWEGDTLRLTEYSPRPLKEEERLALREENGCLTVQWTQKPAIFLGFRPLTLQKHLVVELPQTAPLEEVKASTVSGALYLTGFQAGAIQGETASGPLLCQALAAHSLAAESVSGALRLEGVSARQLACNAVSGKTELLGFSCATLKGETVSGALTATGSGEEIKLSTVSGALSLQAEQYPRTARLNTVSGKISLGLPQEGPGFTVEYDSVSGGFCSRFPLIGDITKRHGQVAFGQGGAALHLETVSGAMELYPLP